MQHFQPISLFLFLLLLITACKTESHEEDVHDNRRADSLSFALNSPELKEINSQIAADPSSAALYDQRARIYLSLRLTEEAINDSKRAVRIDSNRAEYQIALVDLYFATNQTAKARDLLQEIVRRFPENAEAHLKLAELYFLVQKYQLAIDHVNKALRIDEHNARAYYIKGTVYRESGDTSRAISSLETAVEQDNRYEDAYYDLGLLYAARKNPIAFQYYENAGRINPANENVKYARARLLQDLDQYDEAISQYEALNASGKGCPNCCYNIGAIYLQAKNNRQKAIEWFTRAIEEEPAYAEAYFARGYAYALMGKKDKAREDYKQALKIIPNFPPAIQGLNEL